MEIANGNAIVMVFQHIYALNNEIMRSSLMIYLYIAFLWPEYCLHSELKLYTAFKWFLLCSKRNAMTQIFYLWLSFWFQSINKRAKKFEKPFWDFTTSKAKPYILNIFLWNFTTHFIHDCKITAHFLTTLKLQ